MNKKTYTEVENSILAKQNDKEAREAINKDLLKFSIIYLSIIGVIFIFALCLIKTVSMLSVIPPSFFYGLITIFTVYLIITIILATVFHDKIKPTIILIYYKVYDMIAFILTTIVFISFVIMFILTPTTVVGTSMESTLQSGDKLMVWHLGYEPKRNDIVIIHVDHEKYSVTDETLYIKRCVAVAGDKVTSKKVAGKTKLYVNDVLVDEYDINGDSYYKTSVYPDQASDVDFETREEGFSFVIKKGYSLVLGDNRHGSIDSRMIGLVDNKDVLGKAICRVLPANKIGKIKKNILG